MLVIGLQELDNRLLHVLSALSGIATSWIESQRGLAQWTGEVGLVFVQLGQHRLGNNLNSWRGEARSG